MQNTTNIGLKKPDTTDNYNISDFNYNSDKIDTEIATLKTNGIGRIDFFPRTTAPAGYLKANGAAVSVTTYANLADAIYCGDSNNATANECYKCTDPLNPSTTRSTAGGYIVLPEVRGEFIRGWDDSRGIDSGRAVNSAQSDDFKSHYHLWGPSSDGFYGADSTYIRSALGTNTSGANVYQHTSSTGGSETRPRNKAYLACIKY